MAAAAEPAAPAAAAAAAGGNADGPRVLVLGGCGFLGRHLVRHIVEKKLASYVRVADKTIPALAYLNKAEAAAFASATVEFRQAQLFNPAHVNGKAFGTKKKDSAEITEDRFDYVFNLCGETRCGLHEGDYKARIVEPARLCAIAAKKAGVKKFVEVSAAQVYASDKAAASEEGKLDPWTVQARFRLAAEEEVKKSEAPVVILRPAAVYGPGDLTSIAPRIVCGAVYQKLGETMKFLWEKALRLNVVHVDDVTRALWMAATDLKAGSVYNLADSAELTQGDLNGMIGELLGIKVGFLGTILSNMARVNLAGVAESANDKHVPVWSEVCAQHKIDRTPLSPYIDTELLRHNHLSVNGTKITKEAGFKYEHPRITIDLVRQQIQASIEQGHFPDIIKKKA